MEAGLLQIIPILIKLCTMQREVIRSLRSDEVSSLCGKKDLTKNVTITNHNIKLTFFISVWLYANHLHSAMHKF